MMRAYLAAYGIGAALLAVIAFVAWRYFSTRSPLEVARDLKESTPLGIPARALDSGISAATGREETLGGWLAEIFDPATRAANEMMRAPTPLPHDNLGGVSPYIAP